MIIMFVNTIEFHVIRTNISFLLCLTNMNRLNVYLNNLINKLIMKKNSIFIIRRFDHSWLLWENFLWFYIVNSFNENSCFLIDVELKQLHRHFDHLFVEKLHRLRKRSKHEVNKIVLDKFIEICVFCQKHDWLSNRFKFILRKNVEFNYFIIINIMYIDNNSILHMMNEAIRFQTIKWLLNIIFLHT